MLQKQLKNIEKNSGSALIRAQNRTEVPGKNSPIHLRIELQHGSWAGAVGQI